MANTTGATGTSGSSLIASSRVEGTPVKRPNGDALGTIDHLMIEKRSGRVAYAVMSVGGFLGMGEDHHTIPWDRLSYDTNVDAYVLDMSDDQLRAAPRRARGGADLSADPSFDRDWEEHVHNYFNTPVQRDEPIQSVTHEAQGGATRPAR